MIRDISIDELQNLKYPILVDVRSEGEFTESTIPGALNIPLLNNEERAEVGKTYTQISPNLAREVGLRFVSPKLPDLVSKVGQLSQKGSLVLFCWRGGMRSKSLAHVLDIMGIPVYRLHGGYKAYRRKVVDFFAGDFPFHVVVLRGNTGVGKTELLAKLRRNGYPAIDLEGLANNRGSVFGDVGLGNPPTQKTFEALLYEELRELKAFPYIIVECESKRIGRVSLPVNFYEAMQKGTQILIYDSLENRVQRLVKEYVAVPDALSQIQEALARLVKTLGHAKVDEYQQLLVANNLSEFTKRLLLEYYDHLYGYPNQPDSAFTLSVDHFKPEITLTKLEGFLDECVAQSERQSIVSRV